MTLAHTLLPSLNLTPFKAQVRHMWVAIYMPPFCATIAPWTHVVHKYDSTIISNSFDYFPLKEKKPEANRLLAFVYVQSLYHVGIILEEL